MTDLKDTLAALSEADLLAELGLLYNHKDDDSRQFTRWQMLVAIQHGMSLAARSGQLVPVPSVEVVAKDAEIAQLKYELRQIKPYTEAEVQRLQKAMDYGWNIPTNPPDKDEMLGLADAFLAAMKGEGRGDA